MSTITLGVDLAKSVFSVCAMATPEQLWIRSPAARLSFGKVLVAIANKHARQLWAMLAHGVDYDPCASLRHPMHRSVQLA